MDGGNSPMGPSLWSKIKGVLALLGLALAAGAAVIAYIVYAIGQQTNYSPF